MLPQGKKENGTANITMYNVSFCYQTLPVQIPNRCMHISTNFSQPETSQNSKELAPGTAKLIDLASG